MIAPWLRRGSRMGLRSHDLDATHTEGILRNRARDSAHECPRNRERYRGSLRPHDSLGQVPPLTFLPRPDAPEKSTFEVPT